MNIRSTAILSVAQLTQLIDAFLMLGELKNDECYMRLNGIKLRLLTIEGVMATLKGKTDEDIAKDKSLKSKKEQCDSKSTKLSNDLREMMCIKRFAKIDKEGITFDTVLFSAAITLASISPVNDIDAATQFIIDEADAVLTSDRYKHDVETLISWLPNKITNPGTGVVFNQYDLGWIKKNINEKRPGVEVKFGAGQVYPGGDPDLAATMATVRELQNENQTAEGRRIVRSVGAARGHLFHSWVASPAVARLPNGHYAASMLMLDQIQIINPQNDNQVISSIVYPHTHSEHISSIRVLRNGNIAVGYGVRNHDIVIFNPETGVVVDSLRNPRQGISKNDLMIVKGDNIISVCGDGSQFNIHNTVSRLNTTISAAMSICHILGSDTNHLTIVGREYSGSMVRYSFSIYDDHFNLNNRFDCINGIFNEEAVTLLQDGNIAFSLDNRIVIHDWRSGMRMQQFALEDNDRLVCMTTLANGNILTMNQMGNLREYTTTGSLVSEAKIEIHEARGSGTIRTPDALLLAYEQLASANLLIRRSHANETQAQLSPSRANQPQLQARAGSPLTQNPHQPFFARQPITTAITDLPIRQLPIWLAADAAVMLPNGNIALAKNQNHGEIQIVNPETNEVMRSIVVDNIDNQNVSSLALLPGRRIAAGHFNSDEGVHIIRHQSGETDSVLSQNDPAVSTKLLIVRGDMLIYADRQQSHITIRGSHVGDEINTLQTGIRIQNMAVNENILAIISAHECIIYDMGFILDKRFSIAGGIAVEIALLPNNFIAVALNHGVNSFVNIYNPVDGSLSNSIDVLGSALIRCLTSLDNGNIVIFDDNGHIKEYTLEGRLVHEARTNLSGTSFMITVPEMLKLAYKTLADRNELHAVAPLTEQSESPPHSPSNNREV